MTDTPLWQYSACEIVTAIQNGEISAEAAASAAVNRMREVNPDLNAVVEDLGEQAVEHATALDQQRAAGQPCGPLHGVAVTIKINVDQAGHATSNGGVGTKRQYCPSRRAGGAEPHQSRCRDNRTHQYTGIFVSRRYRQPAARTDPQSLGSTCIPWRILGWGRIGSDVRLRCIGPWQ